MTQLRLLILCLIVSFKSFSQTDTVKKIVLKDNIAREVIKDLVKGDDCKKTLLLREEEIKNFKDIVKAKDDIIDKQAKFINIKPRPVINMYVGGITDKLNILRPSMFCNLNLNYTKYNIGVYGKITPEATTNYGISVSYKLF